MIHAVAWSGGKDSTLALDRAVRRGLAVRYLFNIYEGSSDRVRFHGVPRELIGAQARALGLELVQAHTHPQDFEAAFDRVLDSLQARGVEGVIFGNVHLEGIRAWYEERTTARGLKHREPLWGEDPDRVLAEFVERGYRARVVSINEELGSPEWLGMDIGPAFIEALERAGTVDPAGEHGEYHSFVYDGPLFRHAVAFEADGELEREGHRFLDLHAAGGPEESWSRPSA